MVCTHTLYNEAWAGREAVVFSLLVKKTQTYLAFLIPGKTSEAVMAAMRTLKAEYGDRFAQIFKTIIVDNGAEIADFAQCEAWGTEVFFAHPYTSWERPQNERHNGLFRVFVPKGASVQSYSAEYILEAAVSDGWSKDALHGSAVISH